MKIDRILIDILDWIRTVLWRTPSHRPLFAYEEFEEDRRTSHRGVLKRVARDTPRAVATWVFVPKRNLTLDGMAQKKREDLVDEYRYDLYLCCDHLFTGDEINKLRKPVRQGEKRQQLRDRIHTHKISILHISHFLHQGAFETVEVFSREYNLMKSGSLYPNREALMMMRSLAKMLLTRDIPADEWHFEIECERKLKLGGDFVPTVNPADPSAP